MRRSVLFLLVIPVASACGSGCQVRWGVVDPQLAIQARRSIYEQEIPTFEELEEFHRDELEERRGGSIGGVIIGELLAIFPGMLIHGAGHWYAGDQQTARQLSRVGQFGYLLTALGGGMAIGGHFAQEEDLHGLAISGYSTGAVVGAAGLTYFLTAWIYDMIDTPRAVLSGGRPPPRSDFVEALDFFDD
ncbi:MAG: hypothetical protein O7J95_07175 [Planctomycetota bacterium]|nr:hypothetical protein [Planctomycetota bacterium]